MSKFRKLQQRISQKQPEPPDIPVNQPLSNTEVEHFQLLREIWVERGGELSSNNMHDWIVPPEGDAQLALFDQLANYAIRSDYAQLPFKYPLTDWEVDILDALRRHFIATGIFRLSDRGDAYVLAQQIVFPSPDAALYVMSGDRTIEPRDAWKTVDDDQPLGDVLKQRARPN